MDAKDLNALHRFYDQANIQGKFNPNNPPKNYATKWCSNVDNLKGSDETHLQTLDEAGLKNKLGDLFVSVDKSMSTEVALCEELSEKIFAPIFKDWNGCKFDFTTYNGQRIPMLLFSFMENSHKYDHIERSENAVNGIERRNTVFNNNSYEQVVLRTNSLLENRQRQYQLTDAAKEILSNLFYDWVDCTKKVDHENKTIWKQPNWNKYYGEINNNNSVCQFNGYAPNYNGITVTLKNIDPDKVLDLLYNHCKDTDVEEYVAALKDNSKKEKRELKCVRRILVDQNYRPTDHGPDRIVTIECMSKKDWDRINAMTGINRELSNGIKFY